MIWGDIWRYVTDQSDAIIADRLEVEFFAGFDLLARFPRAGHLRADLTNRPVLFFPVGKYMIVYQDTPERLVIHAVLHSARNIRRVLWHRDR